MTDIQRFADSVLASLPSTLDRLYFTSTLREFEKYTKAVQREFEAARSLLTAGERWSDAAATVWTSLPKRGWYLTGREPCTLTHQLAKQIKAGDWEGVDRAILERLPKFKTDLLFQWLGQQGVPEFCANRFRLFLRNHEAGEYEVATFLGVPLIDEITQYLYRGKAFTTKRATGRGTRFQTKPEIAFKTVSGPEVSHYCQGFIEAFGSLQENPDPARLGDENYWNRHAIVHGKMRRSMGLKDSAKCRMAIGFLICALEDERPNDEQKTGAGG